MDTDRKPREFTAAEYASIYGDPTSNPDITYMVTQTLLVCAVIGFLLWGFLG